jgi:hypothetical protein
MAIFAMDSGILYRSNHKTLIVQTWEFFDFLQESNLNIVTLTISYLSWAISRIIQLSQTRSWSCGTLITLITQRFRVNGIIWPNFGDKPGTYVTC